MTFLTVARRQIAMRPTLVLAFLAVPAIMGGDVLHAQTHSPQASKPSRQQKAAARAVPTQSPLVPEPATTQSPAAPAPLEPAQQPPNRARVSWDSRGLEIEASNSSLNQILRQVAADTGAKLEGLTQDQRVFGSYGPGPGSDVLLKLLEGSGYNVLVVGGRDGEAPLEIVLSTRLPFDPHAAMNNQNHRNSSDDAPEPPRPEPPPDPPPADQNPFAIGAPPRDPAEVMDEILHRQQKIDEQAQQDQQNNRQQ